MLFGYLIPVGIQTYQTHFGSVCYENDGKRRCLTVTFMSFKWKGPRNIWNLVSNHISITGWQGMLLQHHLKKYSIYSFQQNFSQNCFQALFSIVANIFP